jgi:hypothetical protein
MCNSSNILLSLLFIFQISTFAIDDQDGPETQDEAIAVDEASVEEPVAGIVTTGSAGSDYNLGRIIGRGPLLNLLTSYWSGDGIMLLDMFHTQGGVDNIYNIGWSAVGTVSGEQNCAPYWIMMFPELSFNAALGNANRLLMKFNPANVVFDASEGNTSTGFESPFYMQNSYQWDFLSKDGKIQISLDQYDNAFYFRPLVNQGQVRISTVVSHTIRGSGSNKPSLFDCRLNSSIGIVNNLQMDVFTKLTSGHSRLDYPEASLENEEYLVYDLPDTFNIGSQLLFRVKNISLTTGYLYQRDYWRLPRHALYGNEFYTKADYILGNSISTIKEVEGNWDSFFKPLLGGHQLHATLGFSVQRMHQDKNGIKVDGSKHSNTEYFNSLRYGLTKWMTIGEDFSYSGSYNYSLRVHTTLMNIPHRTYGPSEASKFEYNFGLWPNKGQVRIDCEYKIPANKAYYLSEKSEPTLVLLSKRSGRSIIIVDPNDFADTILPSVVSNLSDTKGILHQHDFYFNLATGLWKNAFVSNSFEYRIDKILIPHYGFLSEFGDDFKTIDSTEARENIIFADNLTFAFGNPKKNLFFIAFTCFGQTDKRLTAQEKIDFMVSAVYEQAF